MKKVIVGCFLISVMVLGACGKEDAQPVSNTVKQTNSVVKNSSSSTINRTTNSLNNGKDTVNSLTSTTSDSVEVDSVQSQLVGRSYSLVPLLYDGEDVNQAMNEGKAPQNLFHDGSAVLNFVNDSTVHVELAGTYRPDYNTSYRLADDLLYVKQWSIPYSVDNGTLSFHSWTTEVDGHTVTWTMTSNENNSSDSAEQVVDTTNLTTEQLKEWVSAVLDRQFSMGRASFSYQLAVENQDGYAYVQVTNEPQGEVIDRFRINDLGELEEQDRTNGDSGAYKVMATKFMDTSEVSIINN